MNNKVYPILTDKIISCEGSVWFVHHFVNLLYRFDITRKEQNVYSIPCEEQFGCNYSDILYCDGEIVLIPATASRIVFFNVKRETFDFIDIDTSYPEIAPNKFCGAFYYENKLYAIPKQNKPCIVNVQNKKIRFEDIFQGISSFYAFNLMESHVLVLFSKEKDGIVVLHGKEKKVDIISEKIFEKDSDYSVTSIKDNLYIWKSGILIKYSFSKREILEQIKIKSSKSAHLSVVFGRYIVLDYFDDLEYEIYDSNLKLLETRVKTNDKNDRCCGSYWGEWVDIEEQKYMMFNACKCAMELYDEDFKIIESIPIELREKDIENALNNLVKKEIMHEGQWVTLTGLIDYVI